MADDIKKPGFLIRTFLHSAFLRDSGFAAATSLAPKSAKYQNLEMFKQMSPKISETEEQALNSGTVGHILSGFYKGQVDWKGLQERPSVELSAEEQSFLDNEVTELCRMIDEHALTSGVEKNLPDHVWQYIKDKGFLGMGIPREYGGKGFSELAHSEVLRKVGSRSFSGSVCVMVPNSLGLAKSILRSGTQAQKDEWLPKLARGMISAFGLTELYAGSDATAIKTTAVVKEGPDGPYLEIENNTDTEQMLKRFITLAPLLNDQKGAVGVACNIKDPQNLLGKGVKPGITVVLIESDNPGLSLGRRHDPLGAAFPNGTVYSRPGGIKLSIEHNVIGGIDGVGQGWGGTLVPQLNTGRGVSLPSVAEAGMQMACLIAGDYSVAREQFGSEIGMMEENKRALGEMAAVTYMSKAMRRSTLRSIDNGEKPAVEGAISKYLLVKNLDEVLDKAEQITAGKNIMQGPKNPGLHNIKIGATIARTVEGAENLNHGMIIPGQGTVRVHPFILDEIAASKQENKKQAAADLWGLMMTQHIPNLLDNLKKAETYGRNNGAGSPAPTADPGVVKYYEQFNRLSAAFNVVANVALVTVGGALKFKEALGSHLGDALTYAYGVGTALEEFERRGCPQEERPLLDLGCQMYLEKMETALHEFIRNYRDQMPDMVAVLEKTLIAGLPKQIEGMVKNKAVANFAAKIAGETIRRVVSYMPDFLEKEVFPEGRTLEKPLDTLKLRAGDILLNPGPARGYLLQGLYIPGADEPDSPIRQHEEAFDAKTGVRSLASKVGRAIRKGEIANPYEAVTKGILTADEAAALLKAKAAADKVIAVDDFPPEHFRPASGPAPAPPA